MLQPSSPFMVDEIVHADDDGRLFLSGAIEDWKPVHGRGITIVIDLEGDVDHGVPTVADEFLYIYLPIHDGDMPYLERLHAVAQLGIGLNRSALVAGLILVIRGVTGQQAVERLRGRRRGALFNELFARYLLDLPAGPGR